MTYYRLQTLFPAASPESVSSRMHLQWFAAEDEGRTEDPTERKIRKAREEGKVAKSSELVQAMVLLFTFSMLALMGRYILNQIIEMTNYFLTQAVSLDVTRTPLTAVAFINYFMRITLPFFGLAVLAAVAGNVLQVGFLFSTKPIQPDMKKIAPNASNWIKKTVLSPEGAYNLARTLLKIFVIALIAFLNIRARIPMLANTMNMTLPQASKVVMGTAFRMVMEATLFFLFLAIPDYLFQRWQHRESLKMTTHEIKEEYKESEGDPHVKARLKQRMREILQANMMQNVPKATVVITNPTHFAVALEYKYGQMVAPRVIAKGMDHMAQRIKQIARDNGVPMVENRPLARALHANVEIGDQVPEEYWQIVADVLKGIDAIRLEAGA